MVTASWRALGTSVVVGTCGAAALAAAKAAVAAEVDALDRACSRFRADSDLSRLNAASGTAVVVSPLLAEAIRAALRAARLSDGDVDPTVGQSMVGMGYDVDFTALAGRDDLSPAELVPAPGWRSVTISGDPAVVRLAAGTILDLGATAKALGADRAARAAHRAIGAGVIVALGGDIATAGEAPPAGWPVRVTDDHAAAWDAHAQQVMLRSGGLATSSSMVRRWHRGGVAMHHIVDPRTGTPARSPYRTISVAAATCEDANIASTAAMVRGAEAPGWLETIGLPARLVTLRGHTFHVGDWPAPARAAA